MRSTGTNAQGIVDGLHTAVITCDGGLRVTSMNPAAEMMLGVSAKQAHQRSLGSLAVNAAEVLVPPAQQALTSEHPITAHDARLQINTERSVTVDYTVSPLKDGNVRRMIVELLQVDHFLQLAREENRFDRHAANRAVMRGLAHEIKNPLGGLRGAAQLLDRQLSDREAREYTRIIIHEADRLRSLVDRMMGAQQPTQAVAYNIHQVLEHVRRLLTAEVQEGLTISRDYDPSLPDLNGDPNQLIQAVLNLARNSIEAMQNRGTIRFRTRAERAVYIGQQWHRQAVSVDIEDDGPGVPTELKERIFYPMVTGRVDGSGLGLSIAQDIVAHHGGLIKLQPREGATCFTMILPYPAQEQTDE